MHLRYYLKTIPESKRKNTQQNITGNRSPIPYEYKDYLELVGWTGKIIRNGKKGYLSASGEMLLTHYDIQKNNWLDTINNFGKRFYRVVAKVHCLYFSKNQNNVDWLRGKSRAKRFYGEAA